VKEVWEEWSYLKWAQFRTRCQSSRELVSVQVSRASGRPCLIRRLPSRSTEIPVSSTSPSSRRPSAESPEAASTAAQQGARSLTNGSPGQIANAILVFVIPGKRGAASTAASI